MYIYEDVEDLLFWSRSPHSSAPLFLFLYSNFSPCDKPVCCNMKPWHARAAFLEIPDNLTHPASLNIFVFFVFRQIIWNISASNQNLICKMCIWGWRQEQKQSWVLFLKGHTGLFSPWLRGRMCFLCVCVCVCVCVCRSLSIRGQQICPPSVMMMRPCYTSLLM